MKRLANRALRWVFLPMVAVFVTGGVGCRSASGPEEVQWGAETCDHCRMLITDPQFAGQYRLDDGTVRKFDDIVCLVRSYRREAPRVVGAWVMDETGRWIPVEGAWYVRSDRWQGPMGGPWRAFRVPPATEGSTRAVRWGSLLQDATIEP
jgi:copper chaperone NosL